METTIKRFRVLFVSSLQSNDSDYCDAQVLGGMSVGEASYFNYPDAELESMVTDTINNIIPEVI